MSQLLSAMAMSGGSPAMMRGSYTGQMVPTSQPGNSVDVVIHMMLQTCI